jgi:hypothetical protein
MPIEVIHTANASDANSFVSLVEYAYYHERRLPLDPPVVVTGDVAARNVIMATRVLSGMSSPRKTLRWDKNGKPYYYTSRAWLGEIATEEQSLAWGRIGLFDSLGRVILSTVIPQELKDATSELAGQLGSLGDRTLDNDIKVQGITRIKAGSVELGFKEIIESQVLPDAVMNLIPDSWLSEEIVDYAMQSFIFEAL